MRGYFVGCALMALVLSSAHGAGRLSSQLALEAWDSDTTPAHAVVMLAYDGFMPSGWRWALEFNTDTLRLEVDGIRLSTSNALGARLTGELGAAHLLGDYFIDGDTDPSRGFRTSYLRGQVWIQTRLSPRWFLMSELGVRQWYAKMGDETEAAFILPQDTLVLEPRLRLTYWGLKPDAGYGDRFRFYTRDRGLAFGVNIAPNWQLNTREWGALDGEVFDPVDPRNDPDAFQVSVNQWLKAGMDLGKVARLQVNQEAQRQSGADDLYRRTIGGMTPYVVSVPGVPWAYFHTSDYFAGGIGLHWALSNAVGVGPVLGAVVFETSIGWEKTFSHWSGAPVRPSIGVGHTGNWIYGAAILPG